MGVGSDDYASASKPQIDWDDQAARDCLVDSRAKDAYACLAILDGRELVGKVEEAAWLLATVVGQDLEEGDDGSFRIARKVAKDRVISTVDPEARHGHKTQTRSFDGYKGHVAMDPDLEIITDTAVTPGNAGDAAVAEDLISDLSATTPRPSPPRTGWRAPRRVKETRTRSRASTGTTPTAPGTSSPVSKTRGSTPSARPRSPTPPMGSSEGSASWSTSKPTRSPARPVSPSPSVAMPTVAASPSSPTPLLVPAA